MVLFFFVLLLPTAFFFFFLQDIPCQACSLVIAVKYGAIIVLNLSILVAILDPCFDTKAMYFIIHEFEKQTIKKTFCLNKRFSVIGRIFRNYVIKQ